MMTTVKLLLNCCLWTEYWCTTCWMSRSRKRRRCCTVNWYYCTLYGVYIRRYITYCIYKNEQYSILGYFHVRRPKTMFRFRLFRLPLKTLVFGETKILVAVYIFRDGQHELLWKCTPSAAVLCQSVVSHNDAIGAVSYIRISLCYFCFRWQGICRLQIYNRLI